MEEQNGAGCGTRAERGVAVPQSPKRFSLAFTFDELKLLTALASDQLFRREFIDPRMPGQKANPEEVKSGKALVGKLRMALEQISKQAALAPSDPAEYPPSNGVKARKRVPDAV